MEDLITIATRVCIVHFIGHLKLSPEILHNEFQSNFPVILGQSAPKPNLLDLNNFQLPQSPFGVQTNLPIFHHNKFCVNVGILLIVIDILFSEVQSFKTVMKSRMTSIENFQQAPSFIFLHFSIPKYHAEDKNLLSLSEMFALDWLQFSTSAEVFAYNESSIFKINLGCSNWQYPFMQCQVLSPCILVTTRESRIECRKIPDNFNNYVFNLNDVFGMTTINSAVSDCSLRSKYLRNSPQECTTTVFHKLLNLSSIHAGSIALNASTASFCHTAVTQYIDDFVKKIAPWKLKYISYGFSLESFEFVMITRLNSASAEAFIYPFSISVWICIVLGFLLFFAFLSFLRKFTNVTYTLFWIIATFTMQINSKFSSKIRNEFGLFHGYVIVLWIFFIFILGFFYQGSLLSFLIMKSVPIVPQTLREATKLKLPLISTDEFRFGSLVLPTLNHLASLLVDIAKSNNDTHFIEFLSSLTAAIPYFENESTILKTANSFNQFGLIDPPENLNRMTKILTLLNPDLVVVKNFDINPFSSSSAWLVQPNILYKKFSIIISSVKTMVSLEGSVLVEPRLS